MSDPELLRSARVWIVVLGAPALPDGAASPALARRLDRARHLWQGEPDAAFLVLGAAVHNAAVESETMRNWLVLHGVPNARIWSEAETRSTRDQARLVAALTRKHAPARLFVVSDKTHLPRIRLLLRRAGVDKKRLALAGAAWPSLSAVAWQIPYEILNYAKDWGRTRLGWW
ncbi:MAG: YdcF family protein [Myxococcales bacterium]|nr:MAG: YdcF family protein [Myxococcales bacterium]